MKTINDFNLGDLLLTSEGFVEVSESEGVKFYANRFFEASETPEDFEEITPSDIDEDRF